MKTRWFPGKYEDGLLKRELVTVKLSSIVLRRIVCIPPPFLRSRWRIRFPHLLKVFVAIKDEDIHIPTWVKLFVVTTCRVAEHRSPRTHRSPRQVFGKNELIWILILASNIVCISPPFVFPPCFLCSTVCVSISGGDIHVPTPVQRSQIVCARNSKKPKDHQIALAFYAESPGC